MTTRKLGGHDTKGLWVPVALWNRIDAIHAQLRKDDKKIKLHTIDYEQYATRPLVAMFAIELYCDQINPISTTPPERTFKYQENCPHCGKQLKLSEPHEYKEAPWECKECGAALLMIPDLDSERRYPSDGKMHLQLFNLWCGKCKAYRLQRTRREIDEKEERDERYRED